MRQTGRDDSLQALEVSIHAPRVGCDQTQNIVVQLYYGFNSRTPCGVRHRIMPYTIASNSFNSRTPCGVRLKGSCSKEYCHTFQFTHPVWGATYRFHTVLLVKTVSIHAPRVGCDSICTLFSYTSQVSIHAPRVGCDVVDVAITSIASCFNSRTPCGVRPLTSNSPP